MRRTWLNNLAIIVVAVIVASFVTKAQVTQTISSLSRDFYVNGTLIGRMLVNGGNGSMLINTNSTDFASTIFGSLGTLAVLSSNSNAQLIAINASGGDGKSQIVATHSGAGTAKSLELFIDSTREATFGTTGTDRTCAYINGSLRLLTIATGAVIDGGVCPF